MSRVRVTRHLLHWHLSALAGTDGLQNVRRMVATDSSTRVSNRAVLLYLATELWLATSFQTPFLRTKVSVVRTVFARCSPRTIAS